MGSDLPKQFLPVGGKPVLMHTLEAFRKYDAMLQIILVLPREQQDFWKQLCEEHHFSVEHLVADGGETRFHSVKNGLALVEAPGLVGVHDGVRPFVTLEVIRRCYELAEQHKAVIPVVDVVETLRHLTDSGSETVSRTEYKLVQTPQVFEVELLKQAGLLGPVMASIGEALDGHLKRRAGEGLAIEALFFSNQYGILGKTPGAEALLALHRAEPDGETAGG